jgi:hypothetical protein
MHDTRFGAYDHQGRFVPYTSETPADVERRQAEHRQRVEAAIAKRERDAAEYRQEQERRARAEGQAALERYEQEAKQAWLHSGGTALEFAHAWPEMRRKFLAERAEQRLNGQARRVAAEMAALRASGRCEL